MGRGPSPNRRLDSALLSESAVLQYGIDERLLLFSALGLEVGHVEVTADEAARLRLEALELKLLEAVADLRG